MQAQCRVSRSAGVLARASLPAILAITALLLAAASAEFPAAASAKVPGAVSVEAPSVHVLPLVPVAALPLTVEGRPPSPRFRRSPTAAASSLRVAEAFADGTRTNGKILGVSPGLGAYSCSGTAIDTPSRSIVLTAAHCVLEGGRAGRRIAFVPAYDHGKRPYGTFEVQAVYLMPQWRRFENPDFDLAALRVRPNRLGHLTDVVGGRGYATSRSRYSKLQIFGYPAAALRGEELRSCRARGLGADRFTNALGGPPTMPASCDMAAGASGGAWLLRDEYVSGVTSYSYAGRPTRLHSPYFGPQIGAFLSSLP